MLQRRWVPAVLAIVLLLLVAEGGVLLLSPSGQTVAPDDVDAATYFTAAQLQRAADYRGPQLPIYLAQTLLGLTALVFVVARPPRWSRNADGDGARARRVYGRVALTAVALSVLLAVFALPLGAVSRQRGIDVGLVTRSWPGWAADVALSTAIQAGLTALVAVVLIALMRRLPRLWWLPASGVLAIGATVVLYVTPVVLDPLFNDFTPVKGQVRADVLSLAERAGVDVGEVYVVDASKRTTASNAYVAGFGSTKRVVLYDTLLADSKRRELAFVVAHELAHQHYDDVPRGLLYVLLVAPFALLAAAVLTRTFSSGEGLVRAGPGRLADARTVPALALTLALVVPAVTIVSNGLSRRVEARADTFALTLTDDPQGLVDFRVGSVVRNVSEADPGALSQLLFGTHPTGLERLGVAEAWKRGVRP